MSVLVAGGGIAGLVAAYELDRAGVPVTLVDVAPRLGGKIGTERVDGFLVERGPDSFFAARPAAVELCRSLGLAAEIFGAQRPSDVFVWKDGLVRVPEGAALGIPRSPRAFLLSGLFSPREKVRILAELAVPARRGEKDEGVGAFLRRRFGDALVEHLSAPLLEGVYGAPVDELSLHALLPRLRDAERRYGGVLRAELARWRESRDLSPAPPLMLTLAAGIGSLVDALVARIGGVDVRLERSVTSVARDGSRYAARLSDGTRVRCDAAIVATPAPAAARILEALSACTSSAVAAIPHGSTAVVSLGYAATQIGRSLAGHGFLVPPGALAIAACTWSSSKWPGRAPDGSVLLRASVRDPDLCRRSDGALIDVAHAALARVLGIRGAPAIARVARHLDVMPRYTVGHLERLAAVDAAIERHPDIQVIGAAYRGVGVPECIAQGQAAAARVASRLRALA